MLRSDRHVSPLEQRVGVTPQQESGVHPMLAAIGEGPNMSRFENGQNPFAGNRIAPTVRVCHDDAKGSLTEARLNQRRRSVPLFVDRVRLFPEVDLVQPGSAAQEAEPAPVRSMGVVGCLSIVWPRY